GGSSAPAASRKRAPRAASAPVPPSVDAEPPSPITIVAAPRSRARPITWPSPVVCARIGSGRASRGSPLARASSTAAAAPGSSSQAQSTGPSPGPVTVARCHRAPGTAAASTSSVPSPPSASGRQVTWSAGRSASQPRARASAAAAAVVLPLKESGASRTRTGDTGLPCRRGGGVRGLVRRGGEGPPGGRGGLPPSGGRGARVHTLPFREQLQHRVGLLVVLTQPHRERLLGVVLTGDQGAAADVAGALLRRARGDEVVVQAAARAQAPGEHPAPDLGVGQVQVDHAVDVVA